MVKKQTGCPLSLAAATPQPFISNLLMFMTSPNKNMHVCNILTSVLWHLFLTSFPGDKLYPPDTSEETKKNMNTNHKLEQSQGSGLHRMMILDSHTINLQITIAPKYGHLLPVVGQSVPNEMDSRLWLQLLYQRLYQKSDFLACYFRKSTGVSDNINNGSVLFM